MRICLTNCINPYLDTYSRSVLQNKRQVISVLNRMLYVIRVDNFREISRNIGYNLETTIYSFFFNLPCAVLYE